MYISTIIIKLTVYIVSIRYVPVCVNH